MNRFQEPPASGPLCDVLWNDPREDFGNECPPSRDYVDNETRGCGHSFSYNAVCKFLDDNGLVSMIRAHEAQDQGFKMYRMKDNFPSLITVFSAPNYLDMYHNKAAIMKYENDTIHIRQFNASPHPYWLPHFMDAFTWSLPFVGEKVNFIPAHTFTWTINQLTEILVTLLNICTDEELTTKSNEMDLIGNQSQVRLDRAKLQRKIRSVGRMARHFQQMRETAVKSVQLNGLSNGLQGLTAANSPASFDAVKSLDKENEKIPSRK